MAPQQRMNSVSNKPAHPDEAAADKSGRQIDKRVVAGVAGIAVG